MNNFDDFSKKLKFIFSSLLHGLLFQVNPFLLQLIYFTTLSSLGFLALKSTKPRTITTPNDTNLFFTSVSASTVSSMSVVEMEAFSNTQLLFLTALMLFGGEVFTSMLGLALRFKRQKPPQHKQRTTISIIPPNHTRNNKPTKTLTCVVSCYLLVVHAVGSILVSIYFTATPGARRVLERKGIKLSTFSVFTTVSTFSNCGFLPTNENMVAFKNNPGLMLILIPQVLMGNTMYPVFLRLSIWFMGKVTRREEFRCLLESSEELGLKTVYLGMSHVLGLIGLQMLSLCVLEWNNEGLAIGGGLGVYQKAVGFLFEAVNSRHAGESAFDLSIFSPAILVMFVLMMYLPPYPYTSCLPIRSIKEENSTSKKEAARFWEHILFSQQTYLFIFVFLICITERREMKTDPLNFNVLSIVVEVISAHGNVGFSVGYSCQRQISPHGQCKDAWYGFSGRWTDEGKFLLIIVMFVGRLKKFNKRSS